jgi:hypothetical protein
MKRLVTVAIVGLLGTWPAQRRGPAARTTQPASGSAVTCRHGPSETAADASRRQAALLFARQVNTAESAGKRMGDTYYALTDLPGLPPLPDGFQARVTTDGESYVLSVKDVSDACHFAFFADQDGLIYTATPIP